jgi:hypothetical protein
MTFRRFTLLLLFHFCAAAETLPTPKRLNNLVVELLNLSGNPEQATQHLTFNMPREGWVYVAARTRTARGHIFLSFDNETNEPLGLTLTSSQGNGERQTFLPRGDHRLNVQRTGPAELVQLILRRVPEMTFSKFGATPRTLSAGDHNWDFLSKYLLPHVNTVIGTENSNQLPYLRQWKSRGGRWFVEVPRVIDVTKSFGLTNPEVDGVFIDEFSAGMALPKISTDKDVRLYYGGEEGQIDFARLALGSGYNTVWEKYLGEFPANKNEQTYLEQELAIWMTNLKKEVPGALENSTLCLGFFSAPPLTLNRSPEVDFKVWMDRQFQLIATHPAFLDLRSLMEYQTRTADEESLRWIGLLFRHYGLKGKTNLLSESYGFRYHLDHIRNPDFLQGLQHWTVQPTNAPCRLEYSRLLGSRQGRFPVADNWDAALLVQATNGPVEISQTISNLTKGRQYSAKLISINQRDLITTNSEAAFHPVELSITHATKMPECDSHDMIPFSRRPFTTEKPLWIDYRQAVFRADAQTAQLTIRVSKTDIPLLLNFVEVQPYLPRERHSDSPSTSP